MKKSKTKIYEIVDKYNDEIEDITDFKYETRGNYSDDDEVTIPKFEEKNYSGALAVFNNQLNQPNNIYANIKSGDDSKNAYGDHFAPGFGSLETSPLPDGIESYGPAKDSMGIEKEYQTWLKANQLAIRKKVSTHHEKWHDFLKYGQFDVDPVIKLSDLPKDTLSEEFKANNIDGLFVKGQSLRPDQANLEIYIPNYFRKNRAENLLAQWNTRRGQGYYDEVAEMINERKVRDSKSQFSATFAGTYVKNNRIKIIADQGGLGNDFRIWDQGYHRSLDAKITSLRHPNDQTRQIAELADVDSNKSWHHHVGRFTIIRIQDNELGFCTNNENGRILKMLPGRYFVHESEYRYIGKAIISSRQQAISVLHHNDSVKEFAQRLEIICIPSNQVGFVKRQKQTYLITPTDDPQAVYIFDRNANEQFLNCARTNQQVISASDKSYEIVTLRANEHIVLQENNNLVVWEYDKKYDCVHVISPFVQLKSEIQKNNQQPFVKDNITTFVITPQQIASISDDNGDVRFIEESAKGKLLVLREPFNLMAIANKSEKNSAFVYKDNKVNRVLPSANEWAMVYNVQTGRVEFYPSLLDGSPYYFDGQTRRFIQCVDQNIQKRKDIEVDGIGTVSVLNLKTGQIALGSLNNANVFLNPRPEPYIFIPPNRLVSVENANKSYIEHGDLHRVYIAPGERGGVSRNGQLIICESGGSGYSRDQGENGIWVFRCSNFQFFSPQLTTEKDYKIGPKHYVRIGPHEVGYYIANDGIQILTPGSHCIDNSEENFFQGYYPVNIDPIEVKGIKVRSKEGIELEIDVLITLKILDAKKAIENFGADHSGLIRFITENTRSEMLGLCSQQALIAGDFKLHMQAKDHENSENGLRSELVGDIETNFKIDVKEYPDSYGIQVINMKIMQITPDKEFSNQMRAISLKIQEQRSAIETAELEMQRNSIQNQQKIAEKENDIKMKNLDLTQKNDSDLIQAQQTSNLANIKGAFK